jgi:hypothetical protein
MDTDGSPEFKLTWKRRGIRSGLLICRLVASARRSSGNGSGGWPCPAARDWRDGRSNQHGKNARPLNEVATLTGWPAPLGHDASCGQGSTYRANLSRNAVLWLTAWTAPNTDDRPGKNHDRNLGAEVLAVASWAAPKVVQGKYQYASGDHDKKCLNLEGQVELLTAPGGARSTGLATTALAAWNAPTATDDQGNGLRSDGRPKLPGQAQLLSLAPTASTGAYRLNPRFSLWLQGYPEEWACCAERATASSRKSRPNSSKRSSKRSKRDPR